MTAQPTFDDVRKAVIAIRDRLGLEKARSVLNTAVGEGTKLADAQHAPACWSDILAACAAMEAASPPADKPGRWRRTVVKMKPTDVPPNAMAVTLYLPEELYFKIDDHRPDDETFATFARSVLETLYK